MFVLLPVDVATHNLPSESGATTQDEDDSLGGFVGVTSSTLLVVWTPLYLLQATLHTQHCQIQTGPSEDDCQEFGRLFDTCLEPFLSMLWVDQNPGWF